MIDYIGSWKCSRCGADNLSSVANCQLCGSVYTHTYQNQSNSEYGLHKDEGKTRWDLMPWECLDEIAQVFTFGCTKYAERNWENGIHTGRLIGSAFRHIYEWLMGRDTDKESGIHHLAHAAWNIMAIRWMTMHKTEFVNRPNVEGNNGNLGKD